MSKKLVLHILSFLSESGQICEPIFLQDLWRSCHCYVRTTADRQGSLQMFKDFHSFFRKNFPSLLVKPCISILTFCNKYFSWPNLHHSKFSSGKACPHHGKFSVWGTFSIDCSRKFIHFIWTFQKWFSNFERLVCFDFVLADVNRHVATVWGRGGVDKVLW